MTVKDTPQAKPESCESCDFTTEELKAYPNNSSLGINPTCKKSHKWLCLLCASTMAGTGSEYPNQFREGKDLDILQAICFVGNTILKEIRNASRQYSVDR